MKGLCVVLILVFAGLEASGTELFVPVFRQTYGSGEIRIINGTEAAKNQFPHQAAITINDKAFCGGSLISKTWVLTAAHCVKRFRKWTVRLGFHDTSINDTPGGVTLVTLKAIAHEKFDNKLLANDVGLINLGEEVDLNEQRNVIALPPRSFLNKDFVGTTARVSGWGKISDRATTVTTKLRYVDLIVMNTLECRKLYHYTVSQTIYCCNGESYKSTCNGDSGGSLTVGSGKNLTHLGIVSFVSARGCAKGFPSGYTATPFFLDWIANKTGIHINDY